MNLESLMSQTAPPALAAVLREGWTYSRAEPGLQGAKVPRGWGELVHSKEGQACPWHGLGSTGMENGGKPAAGRQASCRDGRLQVWQGLQRPQWEWGKDHTERASVQPCPQRGWVSCQPMLLRSDTSSSQGQRGSYLPLGPCCGHQGL